MPGATAVERDRSADRGDFEDEDAVYEDDVDDAAEDGQGEHVGKGVGGIHAIVETVDRYNPDNLGALEDYVREQMAGNTIDRAANLAVLKLYRFNPDLVNVATVVSVLALSLANLPETDFLLAMCLLDASTAEHPAVKRMARLQDLLEGCRFKEFWEALAEDEEEDDDENDEEEQEERVRVKDVLADFPDFDTRVRRFVSATLALTFRTVPLAVLCECLNMDPREDAEDLADWLKMIGCTVNPDDPSMFDFQSPTTTPAAPAAAPGTRPGVVQENIRFEQLTKIVGASRLIK
ncbi:Eukaryotic translation initiation factor 3 subunit K [Cladochytrium tenue]|nr:Eukaryotic translation initiation factor 3 subunit K [Cladochytrium tenue]